MEQVVGYSRAVVAGSHVWVRWLVEIEAEALIP
jgi:hypothetical protein